MATPTRVTFKGIPDNDSDSGASYDMTDYARPPASVINSKGKGKGKVNEVPASEIQEKLSFDDAFNGSTGQGQSDLDMQTSILPSWISKIAGMPKFLDANVAQRDGSVETSWLQSARQTTGDSDVESVISNESGLGNLETPSKEEKGEDFTDLQLDADIQSIRSDIQTEAETILRILDDIYLTDETALPSKISTRLRKHARKIALFFGDDVVSLKRKIKSQDEEVQKLIRKHVAECTRTNTETNVVIFKLQKEKDAEIKEIGRRHRSETQRLKDLFEYNEQRYQKQLSLLHQNIKLLNVDYPAYHALKEEHGRLKQRLEQLETQSLVLQSTVQRCKDSQVHADAQLAESQQVSQLCYEKLAAVLQEVDKYEQERNAALFEVVELQNMVDGLQTELEDTKKRNAEISQAFEREERHGQELAERTALQSCELDGLRDLKERLLNEVQTINSKGHLISQKNKDLEKENVKCKQMIQGFQNKHAVYVTKLTRIVEMFKAASKDLTEVGNHRANLIAQVTELKVGLVAAAKDNAVLLDEQVRLRALTKQLEVKYEKAVQVKANLESAFNDTVKGLESQGGPSYDDFFNKLLRFDETGSLSEEFADIIAECVDTTLEPFEPFALLIKRQNPEGREEDPCEAQRNEDEPQTAAARRRAEAAAGNFNLQLAFLSLQKEHRILRADFESNRKDLQNHRTLYQSLKKVHEGVVEKVAQISA